jgi:fatty-acyl-CoA synthase
MNVSHWVSHWASWTPSKVALRFEGRQITYDDLEARVARMSTVLEEVGVMGGDRVGYLGPNCPELLVTLFACARRGACFVPLNARMPAPELRVVVDKARPSVLLAADELWETARASCDGRACDVLTFTPGSGVDVGCEESHSNRDDRGAEPSTPVLILFTSGTTGTPKGAVFTNRALAANAFNVVATLAMTADDEVLAFLPMFHLAGLNLLTTPALSVGATVTIHRQFDTGLVLHDVRDTAATLMVVPPPASLALATDPRWPDADLTSLRCVMTGGTTVPDRAVGVWSARGIAVVQGYGLTETGGNVTATPLHDPPHRSSTAGKPTIGSRVRVVDAAGASVAHGEPGEILTRSESSMLGYFANPDATREAMADGWFRTGDIGTIDEDGYVHVIDRIKEIIIVGVSNVYPADLEAILDQSSDIAAAAVVGVPDEELGEAPVAFVVPAPGRSITPQQVLDLFRGRIAAYKHPRHVFVVDEVPRTSVGKVEKKGLRAMAAGLIAAGSSSSAVEGRRLSR